MSINLSRPRVCDTFTLDMASLNAIVRIFLNLLASLSLSQNILNLIKSPAVHLIGKEKNRQPPCLDVWVLKKLQRHYLTEKELQSHLVHFPLKVTPSLPIAIVCGSSSPGAACPTRPWPPPSSTGRWSPPQR